MTLREHLTAMYVDMIGYDPYEDDPTITDEIVATILDEYIEARDEALAQANAYDFQSLTREMEYAR